MLLTTWGVERLVSTGRGHGVTELEVYVATSQILILVAFMFSFVLAMTAAFLGAPAIAADLESGVAQAMLARPIRRSDLVVGRWLGLAAVVVAYAFASGLLEIVAIGFVSGYYPPQPFLASGFLAAQAVVLLTFALLLSTRLPAIAAGAICVVLFGLGWMAGVFAGRRPVLRRRAARHRVGGEPLAAPERRPLARRDLRPRAAGGHLRDARPGRARRGGEPVLRARRRHRRSSSPGRPCGS